MSYSRSLIQLVFLVVDVVEVNSDEFLIAVVVGPVDHSCRNSDDVSLSDAADLLVAVRLLLGALSLTSLLSLLALLFLTSSPSFLSLPSLLSLLSLRFFI